MRFPFQPARQLALAAATIVLSGCASLGQAPALVSFVVIGADGAAIARVLTPAPACPTIRLDQHTTAMTLRAPANTMAQRATASAPQDSKPSAFELRTCEARIPPGTLHASVAGRVLALPRARTERIVVIGDTGCRLKKNGAYQDCNDPAAYPFARIAALAAAWQPDLVVHVGDYHYRENACPAERPGCAGSPWGYGWDTWNADFFTPAQPLLRAAPWVMARGNHESCQRAGQGFRRFLDAYPLLAGRDCNDAADDAQGNHSAPYAVTLGDGAQLIVLDTSNTASKGFAAEDPRMAAFADNYRQMAALAQQARHNIVVGHHPILGIGAQQKDGVVSLYGGDQGLQASFGALELALLPATVQAVLSGHMHLWEQVSFSSGHPSQFVSGFSGTLEDTVPLPKTLPPGAAPAPGALIDDISAWIDGFGFMTMERVGDDQWRVQVWDLHGAVRNTCTLSGKKSACTIARVH